QSYSESRYSCALVVDRQWFNIHSIARAIIEYEYRCAECEYRCTEYEYDLAKDWGLLNDRARFCDKN
ncbi:MAG: hypothetical protein KDA99_22215, partial [Planctomycetales bacterium]|nr:hypothetical protein [Planctomycetales bacterium]